MIHCGNKFPAKPTARGLLPSGDNNQYSTSAAVALTEEQVQKMISDAIEAQRAEAGSCFQDTFNQLEEHKQGIIAIEAGARAKFDDQEARINTLIKDYNKTFEAHRVEMQANRSDIELAGSTAAAHRAAIETFATTSTTRRRSSTRRLRRRSRGLRSSRR